MMLGRTALVTFVALVVLTPGCAKKNTTHEVPALKVGEPVTVAEPIVIADLVESPAKFVGQTVRLEGTVSGVCVGSGCWAEVQSAEGASFIARSLDHSVLVPTDCQGKRIVVQGVVTQLAPPEEEVEEHEHEEGEVPHECPQPTYLVSMLGVELF